MTGKRIVVEKADSIILINKKRKNAIRCDIAEAIRA